MTPHGEAGEVSRFRVNESSMAVVDRETFRVYPASSEPRERLLSLRMQRSGPS